VKATSSAGGSNTHTITINTVTLNTVQCAPDAPRAGDNYDERFKTRNSVYEAPRPFVDPGWLYTYAFHNPKIRPLRDAQATFSYTAGSGSLVNLQTTALSSSGTAANPAVPSGAWDGWVPLPIKGGLPNGPVAADTYVFNADGSVNAAAKRPAAGAVVSKTSGLPPVQELSPIDWQRAFALKRDQDGTLAGQPVNLSQTITMRETGGFLNRWNHTQSVGAGNNWGYNGATYLETYYVVTATFEGVVDMPTIDPTNGWKGGTSSSSNPKRDSAGAVFTGAHNKLQYGKMCKFSYRFTRVGDAQTTTQADTPDATAWNGIAQTKTDAKGICPGGIGSGCTNWAGYGHGASNQIKMDNSIGDSYGDWAGTFYTHDKLPRVAKDFRSAVGRVGGDATPNYDAWQPGNAHTQMPMGNWAFFDYHDGNTATTDTPNATNGTTPPSQVDGLMTQANRLVFP
jgi:hypothetical protein